MKREPSEIEVCPGSGTLSPTWQGVAALSNFPTHGECGICNQQVRVDGFLHVVTHGWVPTHTLASARADDGGEGGGV